MDKATVWVTITATADVPVAKEFLDGYSTNDWRDELVNADHISIEGVEVHE